MKLPGATRRLRTPHAEPLLDAGVVARNRFDKRMGVIDVDRVTAVRRPGAGMTVRK